MTEFRRQRDDYNSIILAKRLQDTCIRMQYEPHGIWDGFKRRHEIRNSREQYRSDFLEKTQAKATPLALYALWIASWKEQGGVTHSSKSKLADSNWMTPRDWGYNYVPYGLPRKQALNLMFPTWNVRDVNYNWDLGHSAILTLGEDGKASKFSRSTRVTMYSDVEEFLREYDIENMNKEEITRLKSVISTDIAAELQVDP